MKTRDEARVDCGEGNEEGETRGCSQHTWRCTRVIAAGRRRRRTAIGRRRGVSTPSPLESLEVGFRFGLVFSRESGFRDYLGLFLTLCSLPRQIRRSVRLLLGA